MRMILFLFCTAPGAVPFPLASPSNTKKGTSRQLFLGKPWGAPIKSWLFKSEAQDHYLAPLYHRTAQITMFAYAHPCQQLRRARAVRQEHTDKEQPAKLPSMPLVYAGSLGLRNRGESEKESFRSCAAFRRAHCINSEAGQAMPGSLTRPGAAASQRHDNSLHFCLHRVQCPGP